jgi:hypothetical protein
MLLVQRFQGLNSAELYLPHGFTFWKLHTAGEKLYGKPRGLFGQFLDFLAFPFAVTDFTNLF